jgi:hypothetical protein
MRFVPLLGCLSLGAWSAFVTLRLRGLNRKLPSLAPHWHRRRAAIGRGAGQEHVSNRQPRAEGPRVGVLRDPRPFDRNDFRSCVVT